MVICGVEEPLEENAHFYALDEETGKLGLSHTRVPSLNRYTFVWTGEDEAASAVLAAIVREVRRQLDAPASWLAAWTGRAVAWAGDTTLSSALAHRARVLASKRRSEGWTVYESEGLFLGTRSAAVLEAADLELSRFDPRFDGRLVLFGEGPPIDEVAGGPARPSLEALASRAEPAPSRQFLLWLAGEGLSLAYFLVDERGRSFVVAISPHQLRLGDMVAAGVVQRVRVGPEAGRVWTE
jgi:hypothetical protein